MKRTLAGLFTIAALLVGASTALAAPSPLPGTPDDTTIKACADYSMTAPITGGTYDPTTGSFMFRVVLADNMCKNVTYSLFVYNGTSATGTPIFTNVRPGDSTTNIYTVNPTLPTQLANVCVYVTTVKPNGTLQDRAPNDSGSCLLLGGTSGIGMW